MKNDNSTFSSIEDGDSFRYTITASHSHTGEGGGFHEIFELEACGADDSALERLVSRAFLQVMSIDPFAVERGAGSNNIIDFGVNLEGKVCLCGLPGLKDINTVVRLATEKGAVALLAVVKPEELSDVPVFVVAKEAMTRLAHLKQANVTFQIIGDEIQSVGDGSEASNVPSDENVQNLGVASSFGRFDDADMDSSSVSALEASRESIAHSTGGSSDPIDLMGSEVVAVVNSAEHNVSIAKDQMTVRQYTVTLKGYGASSSSPRPCTVSAADDMRRPVEPDVSYQILVVNVTRKVTDHVLDFKGDAKKRVLVYASEDVSDIHRVQSLADDKGAVALFVTCAPTVPSKIPLFVVARNLIETMSRMHLGTVKFDLHDTKSLAETIEHPLATPPPTYAAALSGESTVTTRHPTVNLDRKVAGSPYESTAYESTEAFVWSGAAISYSKVAETKPKRSLFGKFVNTVKEAIVGKEAIFAILNDRSSKSILGSYREMKGKIDTILEAGDETEIKKMVSEAEIFLNTKKSLLCHLAASAYICETTAGAIDCHGLEAMVFASICNFDVSGAEFRTLEPRPSQRSQSDRRKALSNVLYRFLMNHVTAIASRTGLDRTEDDKLITVLLFLNACGLFRREFQPGAWRSLRACIDPGVFDRKAVSLLTSVVGESYASSIALCFRRDLNDFVETTLLFDSKVYSQHEVLRNNLMLLVEDQLGDKPVECDLLSAWNTCLVLLESDFFGIVNREKILSNFVARASFQTRGSFSALSKMYGSVGLERPDYRRMQACVKNQLLNDLESRKLDWTAVDLLFRTPCLANRLLSPDLKTATLRFVDRAMSSWSLFENKLLLIDGLLNLFVRLEGVGKFSQYERHLRKQLVSAVNAENRISGDTAALAAFLRMAVNKPSLFVVANTSSVSRVVAGAFATVDSARCIVRDPSSFRDVAYTEDPSAELYHHVVGLLCSDVLDQCNTRDKASKFYGSVVREPLAETPALRCIANAVFVAAFKKWNPTQIMDIKPDQKEFVDVLFAMESLESEPYTNVASCREQVRRLVDESLERYDDGEVSRDILQYLLGAAKASLWCNLEKYYRRDFPSDSAIEEKLAELDSLEGSIQRSLSVTIEGHKYPLAEVLREYNCDDEGIQGLLGAYEYLFLGPTVVGSTTKTLQQMTIDDRLAADLAARGESELGCCAYFIDHQSFLFRDRVMRKDGHAQTLATLCDSVRNALSWFQTVFGPNSNFAGVSLANSVISTLKSTLESELDTLAGCSDLKISPVDIDNFKLVSAVSELSLPIQRFVACCEQFTFAVVRNDISFAELRREIDAFYDSDPELCGVDRCLSFSRSLCRILFPCVDPTQEDMREGLRAIAPTLQIFSTLSLYPELWNYAKEMDWFGTDGLKMFYSEYENVTNVLLGDSESYEMSLLDTMEAAMRVVSAIGSLRETSTSILTLFESSKNNDDIQTGLRGDVELHIRQVHSKLSEIKDWFSNGVDEIAAAHTLFSAANRSGSYSIAERNEVPAGIDLFGTYRLTLVFKVDTGETTSVRTLQDDTLDQFIQQLSLIQNENSTTSAEMQGFVDQYQLLARAAQNVLSMFYVGYEKVKISDFRCPAGKKFEDDANLILKTSETHLRDFTSWLRSTRENFKESLLFWTEELRDLYSLVQAVGQESIAPAVLAERVARLEPLGNRGRARRSTLHAAVESCAAASHRRIESGSSSWLVEVSRFLGELRLELGGDQESVEPSKRSEVVLHSYCCGHKDEAQAVLKILHHLYQDRSPWCFEVLDGAVPCSYDRMALFLERVKAFPAFRFVVVNVDLLKSKTLEKLLSFLSDREIATLGINFHCIQRGESLHTAPWMRSRSWDCDELAALDSSQPNRNWKTRFVSELAVISSNSCGTGKTRYIRNKLDRSSAQAASIAIHERTSVASLIRSLTDKFPGTCEKRVFHISFSFLPAREKTCQQWLREMNYFFFCILALGSVYDPISASSYSLAGTWELFLELPVRPSGESAQEWLLANIPIVAFYAKFRQPSCQYVIDDQARRVCTYLRALSTGTINRKFEGSAKRIVLVLDCSGSMGGRPFQDAVRNAVSIFDTHVVEGDEFGVILFDNRVFAPVPIQTVGADKLALRQLVQELPFYNGGTSMYSALSDVLLALSGREASIESWVVCLTDGVSDNRDYDSFRQQLMQSAPNLHVISVGVNLNAGYEQHLRDLCQKYGITDPKGFFIRSDGTTAGMNNAFEVVKSRIKVSQTFDHDGAMSDDDCRQHMAHYLPSFVQPDDMISQSFWIRFLYRRVNVFDNNDSFNYNEKHDSLGSSLMEVMLSEVERLLGENLSRDWLGQNHAQLIYDFTDPKAPEFRLVCTAPDQLDPDLRQKLSGLDLPGFCIPATADLDKRGTLDRFLSQALDVPLQTKDDDSKFLQCIDDNGFILTLDFTMKLLSIHERIACRIPCLIEGETGVSKSALSRMYSILRNSSLAYKSTARTTEDLEDIEKQLGHEGLSVSSTNASIVERLRQSLADDVDGADDVASRTLELLDEKMKSRPAIFAAWVQSTQKGPAESIVEDALGKLDFFSQSVLERTFFDINVDSSLTEDDFVRMFQEIRAVARKLQQCDATIVIFLDEINTSSVLGLLKQVVIDRCIAGEAMEDNIVVVAALNPPRAEIHAYGRERDLGMDWASGHYQVASLPATMNKLKWSYGSLTHSQEKDFIYRRIEALHDDMPPFLRASLTEVVSESHEIMRRFAQRNIADSIRRSRAEKDEDDTVGIEAEAKDRSRSVVSLRDIQRVFSFFAFFLEDLNDDPKASNWSESETQRRAILLAVATVYYVRLDSQSRDEFIDMLQSLPTEAGQTPGFLEILDSAMNTVIAGSEIPSGIAITRGLKENIFVTLVCSLSQTPLIIVGPPGASKTLSVNTVDANANGSDSLSKFYGKRPRLSLFHYQCSKQSTSKEIAAVFAQATARQERVDPQKHRCVVFMDEAGLPESERESLKVLHYLLEGHMSAKAKVGFVAISNHVLDAAKSNRCVMLLRQEPDEEEMQSITTGVLYDVRLDGHSSVHDVDIDGVFISSQEFASKLCMAYASLFREITGLSHLVTFFGLRDYIYFLKAVRLESRTESTRLYTSVKTLVAAIERNFNGVTAEELRQVSACFLKPFATLPLMLSSESLEATFRHPLIVLKDALTASAASKGGGELDRPRFKLIIDCTEDDSILRLLSKGDVAEVTERSLYKLSNLQDNVDLERLRLISGVKFAALQGTFAVLSQTEPINESFYDLFNQRFREVTGRDGKVTLYANIAVGGISRRSLVRPDFECVVHVRESALVGLPAPFLNRFEKYRLTLEDVLEAGWSRLGSMAKIVAKAQKRTTEIAAVLQGRSDTFGWMENRQTLDSLFVDMLPHLDRRIWEEEQGEKVETFSSDSNMFVDVLCDFLEQFTSLRNVSGHTHRAILVAQDVLPVDVADALERLVSKETSSSSLQDSLRSLVAGPAVARPLTSILSTLIQMVLTRAVTFRLIQLATPESIFLNRHNLPSDVVHGYFQQEHFSLKRLLMGLATETSQSVGHVIHTRSDQCIHAIPSLPADRGMSTEDSETIETVLKLVHDHPHCVIIENLSRLRSEALVRGAIQTWAQHDTRNIFLLLVDMSNQHALDRTNFVRMVVEQHRSETMTNKTFALLLHYSPSSHLQSRCYPALFLGGWQHVFLDSVGNDSSAFDVDRFVALACQDTSEASDSLESSKDCVRRSIKALLPRILPYLASQKLFYRDQDMKQNESFYHRKNALGRLISTTVGDCTIGDILCEKFSDMWLEHALFNTTRTASEALLRGTTQLSLSMSIHSVLLQSFQVFLGATLADANQWSNLDLVNNNDSSPNIRVLELFGLSLRGLPVLPFEELVLQRKQSSYSRLRPMPASRHGTAEPQFPFFSFLSSFFDELVESLLEKQARTNGTDKLSVEECYRVAVDAIEEESEDDGSPSTSASERRSLAGSMVRFVSQNSHRGSDISLFERYLHQFLEWKVGCRADPTILEWFQRRLYNMNATGNVVAIHVVARLQQMEVMKVASVVALVETLQEGTEASVSMPNPESSDLFTVLFDTLERAVAERESLGTAQWSLLFSSVLRRADTALSRPISYDEKLACRLRRLSFFLLSDKLGFLPSIEDSHWLYSTDGTSLSRKDYSLPRLLESIKLDTSTESRAAELLLQHFLSPTWLQTTNVFKEDDISYLLQRITEGEHSGPSHQTAVSLLRSAGSAGGEEVQAFGFSLDVLLLINARISCESLSVFGPQSQPQRACIPHFIPEWLRTQSPATKEDDPSHNHFFVHYEHCFDGDLSRVAFGLLLSAFAREAEKYTSEQLFLLLQREIHSELSLSRQDHTLLSRLRAVGTEQSLRGTPLAAIALSARLVCFVAKIAFEVATEMKTCVFSRTYAREALAFVDELMSLKQASWQGFFMFSILKLRGEGTLSTALGPTGPLFNISWCKKWAEGIPSCQEGAVESLRLAETALAEAVDEEEQKTRELRLCPHCRQPFIVAAANCGQFTCGRDAHPLNGQPALNNTVINDTHGCGQGFTLRAAPQYRPDEGILGPLRARIDGERSKLERYHHTAAMWKDAQSLVVPPLVHLVKTETPRSSLLPSAQLLSTTVTHEEASPQQLAQLLWESTYLLSRLQLLPDLIEFYLWLHDTFRFLVTREDSFRLVIGDLMKREQLQQRFDSARVQHILGLWENCSSGLNEILALADQKVHWECETISIPFEKLENATLVSLLSEGQHPTDGNDFLFLIINETIDQYNVFAEKLAGFSGSSEVDHPAIPPKYVVRGLSGALKIGAVLPLMKQELNWIVESCYDSDTHMYDPERLDFVLQNAINLQDRPTLIANPLDHLRELFYFRNDSAPAFGDIQTNAAITKQNGLHFANRQDAQLVDEVQQLLISLDSTGGDQSIRRALIDNFHSLDYDRIRALLEGTRSLMSHEKYRYAFERVGSILEELVPAKDATGHNDQLLALGFPKMAEKQTRLVLSLDSCQLVELVHYTAHQLASEAYLFSKMPLFLRSPLNEGSEDEIKEGLNMLCVGRNVEEVVKLIEEFVRDVLSFYETQILDGAAKTNSALRSFLSENNFCDTSDPVFAALPSTVSLRHYVTLRLLLHQLKLEFMFRLSSADLDTATANEERNESLTGQCWLWEDEESTFMDVDSKASNNVAQSKVHWKLWFEQALSGTETAAAPDTEAVEVVMEEADAEIGPPTEQAKQSIEEVAVDEEQDPEDAKCRAATLLQRWWRRELELLADMDFSDDDEERTSSGDESNRGMMEVETSYGKPEDERDMRTWLDNHHLPQSTANILFEQGARCVEDVFSLVQEYPELLDDIPIPPLDRMKIKKAVAVALTED